MGGALTRVLSPPQRCTLRIFSSLWAGEVWSLSFITFENLKSSLSILSRVSACPSFLGTETLYAIVVLSEAAICLPGPRAPMPASSRASGRTRQPHKELQPWTLTIRFPACQRTAAGMARDSPQNLAEGSTAGYREEPDPCSTGWAKAANLRMAPHVGLELSFLHFQAQWTFKECQVHLHCYIAKEIKTEGPLFTKLTPWAYHWGPGPTICLRIPRPTSFPSLLPPKDVREAPCAINLVLPIQVSSNRKNTQCNPKYEKKPRN